MFGFRGCTSDDPPDSQGFLFYYVANCAQITEPQLFSIETQSDMSKAHHWKKLEYPKTLVVLSGRPFCVIISTVTS